MVPQQKGQPMKEYKDFFIAGIVSAAIIIAAFVYASPPVEYDYYDTLTLHD